MSQVWDSDRKPERPKAAQREGREFAGDSGELDEADRRSGPLEYLFREAIRRTASLGFSSFFLTEEALRRAFNDSVPREWTDYVARQSEEVRSELFERLSKQFGQWLAQIDVADVLAEVLRRQDLSVRLEISAGSKRDDAGDSARSTFEVISRQR